MDIIRILAEASTKPKSDHKTTAKVVGKNVLHDALAGAAYGGAEGLSRHKGLKLGGKMALAMGGVGAGWGLGEGLIKHKILKKANTKEKLEKTVSHPAYKYGNIASLAAYATASDVLNNRFAGKKASTMADKAKSLYKFPPKDVVAHKKSGTLASKAGKLLSKFPKVRRALPFAAAIGAGYAGRALSDSASEVATSKIYGPERPDVVGTESLYTKKALKTGMGSGKKYKYGGLGQEIKKGKKNKV